MSQIDGAVAVLNVGAGDTKLTFDKKNPVERDRAAKIVTDMLKRGYALLVQVGKKDGEPIYRRAKGFDPKTCEYIIAGGPDDEIDIGAEKKTGLDDGPPLKGKRGRPRKGGKLRRVAADSAGAVAVARTAGG